MFRLRTIIYCAALVISLVITTIPPANAVNYDFYVYVNRVPLQMEVSPQVINGHALVPVKSLCDALHASVKWNPQDQSITIKRNSKTTKLFPGSKVALQNGDRIGMDAAPVIMNNRILVPIGILAQSLGAEVAWDDRSRAVLITTDSSDPLTYAPQLLNYEYTLPVYQDYYGNYIVRSYTDLVKALQAGLGSIDEEFGLNTAEYYGNIFNDFNTAWDEALKSVLKLKGYKVEWDYTDISGSSSFLNVRIGYSLDRDQYMAMLNKARTIAASEITPGMSDLEKEKALHDYLCRNCYYDDNLSADSFSAYGALCQGRAVCAGYAEAFNVLCYQAGIPSLIVSSPIWDDYYSGDWHAWNLVYIDGKYRHVDVTWDDGEGYEWDYEWFNLSDRQLAKNRKWEHGDYPVAP